MYDLHFHCLPGIDDGPEEWDEAVALCRRAAEEGTTGIVATPHVHRDHWVNDDAAERAAMVARLNELLGGSPKVLPGSEVYFSRDLVELCEQGAASPLTPLNGGRYLLVELVSTHVPREAEHVLYELKFVGIVPVLAHPERNLGFVREPQLLERFVKNGAITQITAGSVLGEFGKNAFTAVEEFQRRGLIHTVASDAHNLERRPPRLRAAYARAKELWGEAWAEKVFVENARKVVGNEGMGN